MRGFDGQLASWARARTARWLLAVIACFAAATTSGARAESPAIYMQRVQNELLAAQRSGSVSAFGAVLRQNMDVPENRLTALGPHARALPKAERPSYYSGMINFIAKYAAKTSPVSGCECSRDGSGPGDAGGTNVDSRITLRSGESYEHPLARREVGLRL